MKSKPRIRVRFILHAAGRWAFWQAFKQSLRVHIARWLFGPCVHVRVVSPGDIARSIRMYREREAQECSHG